MNIYGDSLLCLLCVCGFVAAWCLCGFITAGLAARYFGIKDFVDGKDVTAAAVIFWPIVLVAMVLIIVVLGILYCGTGGLWLARKIGGFKYEA